MFFKKLIRLPSQVVNLLCLHLLPPNCILCGQPTGCNRNFCSACLQDLPILPHCCQQCAQFIPNFSASLCSRCQNDPPAFDQTFILFPYQTPVVQIITRLKFGAQLSHAQALAELFLPKIRAEWYANSPLPDLIIPVPLHAQRLRERGFNQALEIARPIGKALDIPIDTVGAIRHKNTQAQSTLNAQARQANLAGAFTFKRRYDNLSLAVLDDVMTTGHTLQAFCSGLKKHGAGKISIWCCARRG